MDERNYKKLPTQFAQVNVGDLVIINKAVLFPILEERIYRDGLKIHDLYLLCRAPNGEEGEDLVKTPYGSLRVFFIRTHIGGTRLRHVAKIPYPKISKVSTNHLETLNGLTKSIDELANEAIKEKFRLDKKESTENVS